EVFYVVFFFQAEDGIRDRNVTGVQTCALPILTGSGAQCRSQHRDVELRVVGEHTDRGALVDLVGDLVQEHVWPLDHDLFGRGERSEERRVGKEWRGGRAGCGDSEKEEEDREGR